MRLVVTYTERPQGLMKTGQGTASYYINIHKLQSANELPYVYAPNLTNFKILTVINHVGWLSSVRIVYSHLILSQYNDILGVGT